MSNLPTGQAAHKTSGGGGALGGSLQAAPAHPGYTVGAVGFGPNWSPELADEVMTQMADSIVELTAKLEEAEARVAVLEEEQKILNRERNVVRGVPRTWGAEYTDTLNLLKQQRDELRQALQEIADGDMRTSRARAKKALEITQEASK